MDPSPPPPQCEHKGQKEERDRSRLEFSHLRIPAFKNIVDMRYWNHRYGIEPGVWLSRNPDESSEGFIPRRITRKSVSRAKVRDSR